MPYTTWPDKLQEGLKNFLSAEKALTIMTFIVINKTVKETRLGCSSNLLGAPHLFLAAVDEKHPFAALPSRSSLRRTLRYASLLYVQAPCTWALLINLRLKSGCGTISSSPCDHPDSVTTHHSTGRHSSLLT
ncbi:MAG: hypothetical protein ACYC9I_02425, partial [Desulfuromonadales bacterium]